MDGLTEGRIVHFVMPGGEHHAALVARVWDGALGIVTLAVFMDGSDDTHLGGSIRWASAVRFSPALEPHTWHWIERA